MDEDLQVRKFLFIGDSITDGNRGRNEDPNHILGHGYVFSIASRLGKKYWEKGLEFVNRGISGNKAADLWARWEKDAMSLEPEVLTILVGINDFTARKAEGLEDFIRNYRLMLDETRQRLPQTHVVLMSPFLLPVGNTYGALYETHLSDFMKYHSACKDLATEFDADFIDLQKVFEKMSDKPAYKYWVWDGIHPTYSGHELITLAWLDCLGKKYKFIKKMT